MNNRDSTNAALIMQHHEPQSPKAVAVQCFLKQLIANHSDSEDHSFVIVVDNPQSRETAAKWHEKRRSSIKRSLSIGSGCRWSSDTESSNQRRSYTNSIVPPPCQLTFRRIASEPSMPQLSHTFQQRGDMTSWTDSVNQPKLIRSSSFDGMPPEQTHDSPPAPPFRRRNEPWGVTDSESEDSTSDCCPPPSTRGWERTRGCKPMGKTLDSGGKDSDSDLSLALISTIEKLSVRAALTLCRPKTSESVRRSTMETIEEAMELLPARGIATDISTTRWRPCLGEFQRSISDIDGWSLPDGERSGCEDSFGSLPLSESPELRASMQQASLNSAMLAAIDRLSVRAALTLTDETTDSGHD